MCQNHLKFRLTVGTIRCGVCHHAVELAAVKVDKDIFLTCSNGHLIGHTIDPVTTKKRLIRKCSEQDPNLLSEYQSLLGDIEDGYKTRADLQKWEFDKLFSRREHFAPATEHNNYIYDLMKQFKNQFSAV